MLLPKRTYMHQFGFEYMGLQKAIANLHFIRLNQEGVFLVDTLVFNAIWCHQSVKRFDFKLTSRTLSLESAIV